MKAQRWTDIKDTHKHMSPKRRARLDHEVKQEVLQLSLRELRAEASKTQVEIAEEAEMTQSQISQIEKQGNPLLTTIRRYVRALGGEVEVVAVIGNKRITIAGL